MKLEIVYKDADALIPYINNARTHSDGQVTMIASSIKEFGFLNPIVIDKNNGVVAGHGRLLAAKKLGMEQVPTVAAEHLTDAQRRAYILADNRIAELSEWDHDLLKLELDALAELDFDIELTGFDEDFFDDVDLFNNEEHTGKYTWKLDPPVYEKQRDKPPAFSDVYDTSKYDELVAQIERSNIDGELKRFLLLAATRHIKINYGNVAELYCHSDADVQRLFENSCLVIPDSDSAIANGFVKLRQNILRLAEENEDA